MINLKSFWPASLFLLATDLTGVNASESKYYQNNTLVPLPTMLTMRPRTEEDQLIEDIENDVLRMVSMCHTYNFFMELEQRRKSELENLIKEQQKKLKEGISRLKDSIAQFSVGLSPEIKTKLYDKLRILEKDIVIPRDAEEKISLQEKGIEVFRDDEDMRKLQEEIQSSWKEVQESNLHDDVKKSSHQIYRDLRELLSLQNDLAQSKGSLSATEDGIVRYQLFCKHIKKEIEKGKNYLQELPKEK